MENVQIKKKKQSAKFSRPLFFFLLSCLVSLKVEKLQKFRSYSEFKIVLLGLSQVQLYLRKLPPQCIGPLFANRVIIKFQSGLI